eukprot:3257769-Pleurochrysis_carterae.AAC.1
MIDCSNLKVIVVCTDECGFVEHACPSWPALSELLGLPPSACPARQSLQSRPEEGASARWRRGSGRRRMSALNFVEVDGQRYSVYECVLLRPWPKAEPWVARIDEILSRISNNNRVQTWLGVRWFYKREDLLPSAAHVFPECEDPEREVYMFSGRLDEVPADKLLLVLTVFIPYRTASQLGACRVLCSADVPNYRSFLCEPNTYFYRYEYNPYHRDKNKPLFTLPGGQPIPASSPLAAESALIALSTATVPAPVAAPAPAPVAATDKRTRAKACTDRAPQEEKCQSSRSAEPTTRNGAAALARLAGAAAAVSQLHATEAAPRPTPPDALSKAQRSPACTGKSLPEKLRILQERIDRTWPPFRDTSGKLRKEFVAVVPKEGEKYSGEGCGRCAVSGAHAARGKEARAGKRQQRLRGCTGKRCESKPGLVAEVKTGSVSGTRDQ